MNSIRCLRSWLLFGLLILGLPCGLSAQQAARKIQPNDVLVIRVLGELDMAKETKVASDGMINYFFVNDVQVGGLSLPEAQEKIRQLLMKDWFVNPQVNIEMKEYARETVTVLGQVERAGVVVLPSDRRVDLVEVIGMAGGFSRLAAKGRIELLRKGKRVVLSYDDLKKITDPAKKVYVEPDDVIDVPQTII